MPIKLIKRGAIQALYESIPQNLERYKSGQFSDLPLMEHIREIKDTNFQEKDFAKLDPRSGGDKDADNAVIVFRALDGLNPYMARDERIWVYLTHFKGLEYSRERWLDLSAPDEKLIKSIQNHFFARVGGPRAFERNNSLACLWWWAYVANTYNDASLEKTLEAFLKHTDVRAQIIERPTTSRSVNVFAAIMSVIMTRIYDKPNPDFFRRQNNRGIYRDWFKKINRNGGLRLLSSFPLNDLKELFESLAISAEKEWSNKK